MLASSVSRRNGVSSLPCRPFELVCEWRFCSQNLTTQKGARLQQAGAAVLQLKLRCHSSSAVPRFHFYRVASIHQTKGAEALKSRTAIFRTCVVPAASASSVAGH